MKGTGRIIFGIFGVCSLVMIYVHLQVISFLASYDIQRASEKIYTSTEQLHKLKYEVEQFKAPHLLEGQVRQYEMDLAIPEMVYRVPQSFDDNRTDAAVLAAGAQPTGMPQLLRQVLNSWIQVAHAKNENADA